MAMQYAPETAAEEQAGAGVAPPEADARSLPLTGQEPPPGEAGEETPPPAPDYVPKAEFEALKKQAEELAAWRAEQQQREQAAQQQQTQQQQRQMVSAIEERVRSYNTTGVPDEDIPILQQALTRFAQQNSAEFQQQLRQTMDYVSGLEAAKGELERGQSARKIVLEHLAPTLFSNMTPAQVLRQLNEWETELLSFKQGTEVMESLAKRWASDRIRANGAARQASGAEATERGGTSFGGGGNPMARYKEALRKGGPLPSPQEIDRITAAYLR